MTPGAEGVKIGVTVAKKHQYKCDDLLAFVKLVGGEGGVTPSTRFVPGYHSVNLVVCIGRPRSLN